MGSPNFTHQHWNEHEDGFASETPSGRGRGDRKRRRGPGKHGQGKHGPSKHGHAKHGRGGGRQRARRGAAAEAVLLILAERPGLHGYELMNELESRTSGSWRPSPGSMYPTLSRLEDKGLIVGTVGEDGKRAYDLTEAGQNKIEQRDPDAPLPWENDESSSHGRLRPLIAEVASQTRQIGRFGTEEQRQEAVAVLSDAKAALYKILVAD